MENSREFTAPYVFREYPKWVTLADGTQIVVNNADEEAIAVGPKPEDEVGDAGDGTQDDKAALLEQARALGLTPHPNTGAEKLKQLISEAQS